MLTDDDRAAERDLIQRVAQGSGEAVGELYDRFGSTVYGLALRVLGQPDLAEEVVQDVFAQVWREAARYDPARASLAGWIIMLTRTRAIDRLRARRARPDHTRAVDETHAGGLPSPDRNPEAVSITAAEVQRVKTALAALPDTLRSIIELAYYEGLSHSEIATRTGMPLGTVKTRLRSAMGTLRGALA